MQDMKPHLKERVAALRERVAKWLRRLTRKPKVSTVVGSNPALDSLVAVRNSSPGRPVPCEGNLVAAAGSCGRLMVKHPWPLLEISLSDFHRLATLNINTYSTYTYLPIKTWVKNVIYTFIVYNNCTNNTFVCLYPLQCFFNFRLC